MENTPLIILGENPTIITRTSFCEYCFKEDRPNIKTICMIHGSKSNKYKTYKAVRNTYTPGFVPFVYKVDKIIGQNVTGWRICSVNGCGVEDYLENHSLYYRFIQDYWERFCYSLERWNALVLLKDHSYYI